MLSVSKIGTRWGEEKDFLLSTMDGISTTAPNPGKDSEKLLGKRKSILEDDIML